ncbi:MAG: hypothetical protein HOQ21_05635 [Dermatophilaceae bacterium]|nr:hypothetical protein [Dermatophilaceae bacterium]
MLVAFALGALVTWLLTMRRDSDPVPSSASGLSGSERPAEGAADDASAFGGPPSEFSSQPGAAESWHRDWEDEDALMTRRPTPGAREAEAVVPPVAEATPNGDLAGVGEPQAVQAVDAVEVDAKAAQPEAPTPSAGRSEQRNFEDATEGDEAPSDIQPKRT